MPKPAIQPWTVEPIWKGLPCIILGGGPSLGRLEDVGKDVVFYPSPDIDWDSVRQNKVIGCNNAYELGPELVDVCYSGDCRWFFNSEWVNRVKLLSFSGLKVSSCPDMYDVAKMKKHGSFAPGILRIKRGPGIRGRPIGMSKNPNHIVWNGNTGASAINLAYLLGCRDIILLGFDFHAAKVKGKVVHNYHSHHKHTPDETIYENTFLRYFKNVAEDCKKLGVRVINATEGSSLEVFEKMSLREALTEVSC